MCHYKKEKKNTIKNKKKQTKKQNTKNKENGVSR